MDDDDDCCWWCFMAFPDTYEPDTRDPPLRPESLPPDSKRVVGTVAVALSATPVGVDMEK